MNLILDAWLPVRCRDGTTRTVRPADIVAPPDAPNAPMDLSPPRPDFRGALLEFLVGLMQTACPPTDDKDWARRLQSPPDAVWLQERLEPLAPYFNLLGERPRFQQDLTLGPDEGAVNEVSQLLIDAPGGNALKNNSDFFVKRGQAPSLCPACAAMALQTLQAYAPAGGKGHRTSLRGGGPLTTLARCKVRTVEGQAERETHGTLWQTVAANTLPLSMRGKLKPQPLPAEPAGNVFPWVAPTLTSEEDRETRPDDRHFLHVYWAMPRRILLLEEEIAAPESCALCAEPVCTVIRRYATRPHGHKYSDTWVHPLTPYREQKSEQEQQVPLLSIKGRSDGTAYNHWLGLVYGEKPEDKYPVHPAVCVEHAREALLRVSAAGGLGILACGYDMDNMKPLQWSEGELPVLRVPDEAVEDFRSDVARLVHAAEQVRGNLVRCLKEGLFSEGSRADAGKTRLEAVSSAFWADTRPDFFAAVGRMAKDPGNDITVPEAGNTFAKAIQVTALRLFDREALSGNVDVQRMKRVFEARGKLANFNRAGLRKLDLLLKTEAEDAGTETMPQ